LFSVAPCSRQNHILLTNRRSPWFDIDPR
jgi:hypothetical protein